MSDWIDDTAIKQIAEKYQTGDTLVQQRIDDIASGKIRPMPMPWSALTTDVRALVSGTVNVLCGDPGSAKSFLTLELFAYLHRSGEKVALYELECTKQWHLMRVLAQVAEEPLITDMKFLREEPDKARNKAANHREFLESFGRCLHASPDACITAEELLRWVEQQCQNGVKVIGIDPITALMPSEKPWLDDHHLITQLRRIIGKYDATAWIVTHPKKGRKFEISLDVLAGGAAFARFTDTVLWLERLDKDERHVVFGGSSNTDCDRVLHVCKCRDGVAAGRQLSMRLNKQNLKFDACGWITERHEVDKIANEIEGEPF
jgi:KaiC/GvpD/RAD55 family RecA-like ATPase